MRNVIAVRTQALVTEIDYKYAQEQYMNVLNIFYLVYKLLI